MDLRNVDLLGVLDINPASFWTLLGMHNCANDILDEFSSDEAQVRMRGILKERYDPHAVLEKITLVLSAQLLRQMQNREGGSAAGRELRRRLLKHFPNRSRRLPTRRPPEFESLYSHKPTVQLMGPKHLWCDARMLVGGGEERECSGEGDVITGSSKVNRR